MKLKIIGASGHGKVVADIAVLLGYDEIEFYDDDPSLRSCGGWPVVGMSADCNPATDEVFVAIGMPEVRSRMMAAMPEARMPVLVHPRAVVARDVSLGRGSVVMAGAVINPGARLGQGVIVNTCSSVDHDCVLEDFVHVSVGAHLCGTDRIGARTWVGAGSTVSNNLQICADCMIGAGAVVVRPISEPGVYYGVPAALHRHSEEKL
jgi:sugar O-acyltransferase (sialic acid O-acetyltransferase NeuD family)